VRRLEGRGDYSLPAVELPPVPSGADEILFGLGHVYEVMDFVAAVQGGHQAPVPAADGRHLMAVIETAYRSATEREEVDLSEPSSAYTDRVPDTSLLSPGTDV
jgi:predicted dehydrogenase